MKNVYKLGLCFALVGFLSGCASTKQFVAFPDQTKRVEDPNKARIYVVRPTSLGGAVSMDVRDGGKIIGSTGANGYLCWERNPGAMEITGKAENTVKLPLTVEKGGVYYIQQHVKMGFLMARNKLSLLSEAEGKEKVKQCKPPTIAK